MGRFSDLLGTIKTSFKIGKANFVASGVTVARTLTVPDASGTIALTSRPVVNKTADYAILASESGTIFTNTDAITLVNFTLPNTDLVAGETRFGFMGRSGFVMNVYQSAGYICAPWGDTEDGMSNNGVSNLFLDLLYIGNDLWAVTSNTGWASA
jgi:hypothetical protein